MIPLREIFPETPFQNAYIKDESKNPFGSIKDRRNIFLLNEAVRLGVDKLALITSGNNGYSLAALAKGMPILVVCIVDKNLDPKIKKELKKISHQMIETNLQHKILRTEEVINFAREKEDEFIWDVTNGYDEAYKTIVAELRHVNPNYIVTPVGSGENFVGLVNGVEFYRMATKIIGIGTQSHMYSVANKLYTPWTPYTKILTVLQKRGHTIYRLTEEEIRSTYEKVKDSLHCEPSSSIVFAADDKHNFRPDDVIVFINSGCSIIERSRCDEPQWLETEGRKDNGEIAPGYLAE